MFEKDLLFLGSLVSLCFSSVAFAATQSWESGNVTCTMTDEGTMTFTAKEGTDGRMVDYTSYTLTPWASKTGDIERLVFRENVTYVGKNTYVPADLSTCALKEIVIEGNANAATDALTLPDTVKVIADLSYTYGGFTSTYKNGKMYVNTITVPGIWTFWADDLTFGPDITTASTARVKSGRLKTVVIPSNIKTASLTLSGHASIGKIIIEQGEQQLRIQDFTRNVCDELEINRDVDSANIVVDNLIIGESGYVYSKEPIVKNLVVISGGYLRAYILTVQEITEVQQSSHVYATSMANFNGRVDVSGKLEVYSKTGGSFSLYIQDGGELKAIMPATCVLEHIGENVILKSSALLSVQSNVSEYCGDLFGVESKALPVGLECVISTGTLNTSLDYISSLENYMY